MTPGPNSNIEAMNEHTAMTWLDIWPDPVTGKNDLTSGTALQQAFQRGEIRSKSAGCRLRPWLERVPASVSPGGRMVGFRGSPQRAGMKSNRSNSAIESLETRIAPAGIFTFQDVDGDAVTIKTSKGTNAQLEAVLFLVDAGIGKQLQKIDLSANPVFAGTDLSVVSARKGTGDGLVNVGYIDATDFGGMGTSLDLGKVTVDGDLGQIDAGTGATGPAVKDFTVRSLGALGLSTQGAGGNLNSFVKGAGTVKILRDVIDAQIGLGETKSILVGGSVIGGRIDGGDSFRPVSVVKIGGDLIGGASAFSGNLGISKARSLVMGGSILGGSGEASGFINSMGGIDRIVIKGSVIGGTGSGSGNVFTSQAASIVIGGDVVGGGISGTETRSFSGFVNGGTIKSLVIGGSLVAGTDTSTGSANACGAVAIGELGSMTVKRGIVGNQENPASIIVRGDLGSLTVGGTVKFGRVLAGYQLNAFSAVDGNSSIGSISVGGDWIASSAVAGVKNLGADGMIGGTGVNADYVSFADGNDVLAGPAGEATDGAIARIASITIKGTVSGTAATGDHFGFVAQQIGAVKIGGFSLARTAGTDAPAELSLLTGDVTVREI